jgi:hypothetical protein
VLQSLLLRAISLRSQCLSSVPQLALKLEHTAVVTTPSMLARRVCAHALNSLPVSSALAARSRSFTAATATQSRSRAPALADITPSSAASFNKKQQEFREGLAAEQKQREQQESTLFQSRFAHAMFPLQDTVFTDTMQRTLVIKSKKAARRRAEHFHHSSTALPKDANLIKTSSAASRKCWLAANMSIPLSSTRLSRTRRMSTQSLWESGTRKWHPSQRTKCIS